MENFSRSVVDKLWKSLGAIVRIAMQKRPQKLARKNALWKSGIWDLKKNLISKYFVGFLCKIGFL